MKPASFVELLKGEPAELALLTTYNFEPAFFEECLLRTRSLGEARRVVVFADASEWSRSDTTRVRGLNCRYLVVPMRRKAGVFHPKLTLLLGAKSAALICGSANLSRAGCTHNLDLLNSFPFSFNENAAPPERAHLLGNALAFFRECAASATEGLRGLLGEWLDELPLALPWLPSVLGAKPNANGCQLRHTLAADLWSVIRAELSSRTPRVVRVLSPFYDDDLALAARIRSEWPGCRVEITAQQSTSAVPVNALAALGSKVTLHELRGAGSRRLHAKLCAFEHARGTLFIAGSANFTTAAFDGRNVETCLVWHDRDTGFHDLFAGEITRRPIAAEDFDSGSETPPELRPSTTGSGWQLLSAVLDENGRLQFQFSPPPSGSGGLSAHLFVENQTRPVLAVPMAANARGSGECQLTDEQAALLQGPVRCELRLGTHTSDRGWLVQQARLVAALTAIGIPLDDDCPYLETRELVEGTERRLVTWTLKAKSICGQHDARKLIEAWHDLVWTTQNNEHPFAYITTAFRNAGLLAAEVARLAPVALIRKGKRFALVPFDATPERRQELLTALEK